MNNIAPISQTAGSRSASVIVRTIELFGVTKGVGCVGIMFVCSLKFVLAGSGTGICTF